VIEHLQLHLALVGTIVPWSWSRAVPSRCPCADLCFGVCFGPAYYEVPYSVYRGTSHGRSPNSQHCSVCLSGGPARLLTADLNGQASQDKTGTDYFFFSSRKISCCSPTCHSVLRCRLSPKLLQDSSKGSRSCVYRYFVQL